MRRALRRALGTPSPDSRGGCRYVIYLHTRKKGGAPEMSGCYFPFALAAFTFVSKSCDIDCIGP